MNETRLRFATALGTAVRLAAGATLVAIGICSCTVYEPAPVYTSAPSKLDRAWQAALGAAQDVAVDASSADRSTGVIYGTGARCRSRPATVAGIRPAHGTVV
jgi:hypothetical protein